MTYTRTEFIAKLAPYAVEDMRKTRIAASLTIAQACLESADGNSGLTSKANNLFGIKGSGPAGSITLPTTEYINGRSVRVNAAFRAYRHWGESVADHSALIRNGVSWNRNLYRRVIGVPGKQAAMEIAAAGYATDPRYADKLLAIMQANHLERYDLEADNSPTPDPQQPSNPQPPAKQPVNNQPQPSTLNPLEERDMEKVKVTVNGQKVIEGLQDTTKGVTYVPVRSVAEALGATVLWDGATGTVKITQKEQIR
jgi:hypothetical protein